MEVLYFDFELDLTPRLGKFSVAGNWRKFNFCPIFCVLPFFSPCKRVCQATKTINDINGLVQVQKMVEHFRIALSSFVKVLWVYPDNGATLKLFGYIYVQLSLIYKGEYFYQESYKYWSLL